MTSTRIAAELGMPTSTVCAVLDRLGLNQLSRREPPEPPNRYCRRHPGELIHVDIKKLGRFEQPYKSTIWATTCTTAGIRHLRTQPYRPRTNGKAERFIQTMLREWADAATYQNSHQRGLALEPWLDYYNHRRPHGALGHRPPISRLEPT